MASADPAEMTEPAPAPEYALELEPAPAGMAADDLLGELSSELDGILPSIVPAQHQAPTEKASEAVETSAAETAQPVAGPAEIPLETKTNGHATEMTAEAALHTETGDPLADVFNEFRADLGELAGEKEDPETHYNLGIAYREMGLLDEAISEFQRVAKVKQNGKAFRYAMQCCTLLGLAFIEKGQPAIAAMWYERALESPGLEQESIIALRYDLGVAQELAGDKNAARKSFSQVYGMNIDYRDVAERLAALGKG
jgi:tetratricopeptide (TPR) repeat protein